MNTFLERIKRNSEKTIYIDLKNVQENNPLNQGAKIIFNGTVQFRIRSLCLRFYVLFMKSQNVFMSNDKQIGLWVNFGDHVGFFLLNTKWFIFPVPKRPLPFAYNHVCFSHNETHYYVASEGKLWYNSSFPTNDLPLIKMTTKIKEIEFGPGPKPKSNTWHFTGKISEFNMFSNTFTEDELITLTKSCSRVEKGIKVFDWSEILTSDIITPQDVDIPVKVKNKEYFCSRNEEFALAMIPFPMTAEYANTVCKAWGGYIFLPESLEDLQIMKNLIDNGGQLLRNYTYDKDLCKDSVWLPIYKADGFNKWVDYNNRSKKVDLKISFDFDGNGQSLQMCASNKYIGTKTLSDAKCTKRICTICVWKPNVSFQLRGLCEKSDIEYRYLLKQDLKKDEFFRKIFIL